MFGGEVRSATVEALDDMQAVAILAGDLKRLLNEHPEIAVKLLGALGEKLREANARIARQSFQKVSSRVAGVLAELAETGSRAGALRGRTGRGEAPPREVVVHSTQADLAQLAGTSREAASRFLATLQRAGRRHDPPRPDRGPRPAGAPPVHLLTRTAAALAVYALLWGLIVEGFDAAQGDAFDPLDMVTHAVTVGLALAAWPLFRRAWRPE